MNEKNTTYDQRIYELTVLANSLSAEKKVLISEKAVLEKKLITFKRSLILGLCFLVWSTLNNPLIFQWHHV